MIQHSSATDRRDEAVLLSIRTYYHAHGYGPTVREVARLVGIGSTTVHHAVERLQTSGLLARGGSRSRIALVNWITHGTVRTPRRPLRGCAAVAWRMIRQAHAAGTRMPSIRQVASAAGVGTGAVWNALQQLEGLLLISRAERSHRAIRVLPAADECG